MLEKRLKHLFRRQHRFVHLVKIQSELLHLNTKQDISEQRQMEEPQIAPSNEFKARLGEITQKSRKIEGQEKVDVGFAMR